MRRRLEIRHAADAWPAGDKLNHWFVGFHVVFKLYPRREKHQPASPAAMIILILAVAVARRFYFHEPFCGSRAAKILGCARSLSCEFFEEKPSASPVYGMDTRRC